MNWLKPEHWHQIIAIDAHTGGEPLRIYTEGYPEPPGSTILAKRRYALENLDYLRTATMWEPRGHADMYGCLITKPVTTDGDFGVLFLHNEGYSSMCGHGIIAVTKVALETGLIRKQGDHQQVRIDTPAGRVTATARWEGDQVIEVSFLNVPSFVYLLDRFVYVPGLGEVQFDIAFGGAFYAFVDAESVNVELTAAGFRKLIELGILIKQTIMENHEIKHPFEDDLGFLYGVIFVGAAHDPGHHSRNVCVFADGEVDRSPTGTGVSARTALHFARGEISLGQPFVVESILGTCFSGEAVEKSVFGSYEAVIPKITGSAHICGINTLLIDPDDPLRYGFILR
ncbi:MAG: proline racemase family protein [Clostridia bacterium]|nr:proline racemase family protein [Clostridia bacterium]